MQKILLFMMLFVAALLVSSEGVARPADTLQSPMQASFNVSGNRAPSIEQVRNGIVQAGSRRGWLVANEQPGQLQLRNDVRGKHLVVINVFYDTKGVRIEYVSSQNMKYEMINGVAYIHPKYNEWVSKLLREIVAGTSP
jgi:hypothetical protein